MPRLKRRIFILALICILLTAAFAPNSSAAPAKAEKEAVEISAEQVKAARFLNMLNHNPHSFTYRWMGDYSFVVEICIDL